MSRRNHDHNSGRSSYGDNRRSGSVDMYSDSYNDVNVNNSDNDNNNYHLRNPYSQRTQAEQQLEQQQQQAFRHNNQNQNHPHRNPYTQKTQQQRYAVTTSSLFAINPVRPKQQEQLEYHQEQAPMNDDKRATAQSPSSRASVLPDVQQQEAAHDCSNSVLQHAQDGNNGLSKNNNQQHQQQLLERLQAQLDESNESNFELEASVVALEAELQHTRRTIQEQAQLEKSKMEHELRLAQREAKRWKLLLQQNQSEKPSNQGRSIVSDSSPSSAIATGASTHDAFSSRLLGNQANLQPSRSSKTTPSAEFPANDVEAATSFSSSKKPKRDVNYALGFNAEDLAPSGANSRRRATQNAPLVRLALNLLAQLEPSQSFSVPKPKSNPNASTTLAREDSKNDAMVTDKEDDVIGYSRGDDSNVRQVLLSIATSKPCAAPILDVHERNPLPSPLVWTEGTLIEWLVKKSSSESADRYWSAFLLQSPEARKHVVEQVGAFEERPSGADSQIDHHQQQQQKQYSSTTSRRRNRRKDRIRPLLSNGDHDTKNENGLSGQELRQVQVRKSLRNPWWNPNDNQAADPTYSIASSSCLFREWIQWLSASQNPMHLQTLRILLAEATGRNGLAATVNRTSEAWWNLCYPSIATTIQRITYRKLIRSRKNYSNDPFPASNSRRRQSAGNKRNDSDRGRRSRNCIGRYEDFLARLPVAGTVVLPASKEEDRATTAMDIDIDESAKPGTTNMETKRISSKNEGGNSTNGIDIRPHNDASVVSEEAEDQVFELALALWVGILQAASPRQLGAWYKNRKGLGTDQSWHKKKRRDSTPPSPPPSNGLFMISLLLDLFEELQFGQWMKDNGKNGNRSMSSAQILSNGLLSSTTRNSAGKNSKIDEANRSGSSFKRIDRDSCKGNYDSCNSSMLVSAIPQWYIAAIAVLAQVGRTENGMEILRTRLPDDRQSDWMGNALDVSIRQMHTLALHLDDVHTRHGSIVRLGESSCAGDSEYNDDCIIEDDPHAARLRRSVEAWVRVWHQVLIYVQSKETVSFRSLVLDLQDWFTSSCATLLTSEEIRPEIRSMIRWQLDELKMDEEDFEESRHHSR